jgi:hypothetical protein
MPCMNADGTHSLTFLIHEATGLVHAIEVSLGADLSIDITGDFIPNNWDFDIWVSVHAHPILLILSLS